ncbi:MAG: hypothetical protein R3B84_10870 [Zavarzinella sp.]
MEAAGIEPLQDSPVNEAFANQRGTESGTLPKIDADLQQFIRLWPTLPESIRKAIKAMIESVQ